MTHFNTILSQGEAESVISKSRFIALACHVESEADVDRVLAQTRKVHYKATHICSAYILATEPERQKASDDGEPSGTAGKPILDAIARRGLKNVLVLVVRYFGGVKLGAGGLIRAYAGAASQVLDAVPTVRRQWCDTLRITIDYTQYGGLRQKLSDRRQPHYQPVQERFADTVSLDFEIPTEEIDTFLAFITEATNDRYHGQKGAPKWVYVLADPA
ncbi:YigZ family protein [Pseudoramibacter alactolyticus ATCC 23263]|uniref:YigZ family protein n=1 Tax=Pseudoramibacter alactolyticus ATCC 23263 TaxID=887929 RepID=E6MI32_9FIRM|nr:YigZ family protein [Pseudoramibacter alactolyticus]EFV01356.1 YigZ family protein [Pseudoramibacter alactolyticus ATCC 23263]